MSDKKDEKIVIGSAEPIGFPEIGAGEVFARIDTGAKTSAIWASRITQENGVLTFVFFDKSHPKYSGKLHHFHIFDETVVISSNGQRESRYKVRLLVRLKDRNIRANFTLADRSTQVYPVLIGRNVLKGKFVVDVKEGKKPKRVLPPTQEKAGQ